MGIIYVLAIIDIFNVFVSNFFQVAMPFAPASSRGDPGGSASEKPQLRRASPRGGLHRRNQVSPHFTPHVTTWHQLTPTIFSHLLNS